MRNVYLILLMGCFLFTSACVLSTTQGMQGSTFISKTGTPLMVSVPSLPLRTAGQVLASVSDEATLGGVTVPSWIAVYGGESLTQPMAVVAQASLGTSYYWDANMVRPFSLEKGLAILGNHTYQTCTFVVGNKDNPFIKLIPGAEQAEHKWLVHRMAMRTNINQDKITLEYRELLPAEMDMQAATRSISPEYLREFAKRAEAAFVVKPLEDRSVVLHNAYPSGLQTQYLDVNFFGGISQYESLAR